MYGEMAFELRITFNVDHPGQAKSVQLVETTHPSSMLESSRKHAATSPLGSEFDKKSRLGLTDEELNDLNEHLGIYLPRASVEGLSAKFEFLAIGEGFVPKLRGF